MDTYEAIRELRRVTYKPEWRPWFSYVQGAPADTVQVFYEIWVVNTTPRHIDPRSEVLASGSYSLPVGLARDAEELHRMNLDAIIREIETHEAREAYRVDGYAPFHPHRRDGERRYNHPAGELVA